MLSTMSSPPMTLLILILSYLFLVRLDGDWYCSRAYMRFSTLKSKSHQRIAQIWKLHFQFLSIFFPDHINTSYKTVIQRIAHDRMYGIMISIIVGFRYSETFNWNLHHNMYLFILWYTLIFSDQHQVDAKLKTRCQIYLPGTISVETVGAKKVVKLFDTPMENTGRKFVGLNAKGIKICLKLF